ncbi:MAG: 2-dehydropantoate 2-reductase [Bacteroidetes bacterium]|nr:MAG: 2-dehydropantoate 2-reductase [Bacteroidota bacterium]
MKKIVISGIGGVGGYFGGLLAHHFRNTNTEIYFIARGENEKAIRQHGLRMETGTGNFTAYPKRVSAKASDIGPADLFICCTKTYDLEENIEQSKACIGSGTVILPLHNGVDSRERIKKLLPGNETWDGCVYLVSRLAAPGLIRETGNIRKLFFGSVSDNGGKQEETEHIFRDAGIEAQWSPEIESTTWEKFCFISPLATVTSHLDSSIGATLADEHGRTLINALLPEIKAVADSKQIRLPENIIPLTQDKMAAIPYETKTSMHSDFQKGGKTELESLTGYVVRSAQALHLDVPNYERLYEALKNRNS